MIPVATDRGSDHSTSQIHSSELIQHVHVGSESRGEVAFYSATRGWLSDNDSVDRVLRIEQTPIVVKRKSKERTMSPL